MKSEADIILKLRQAAQVGGNLLEVLDELAHCMEQNPNLTNTAIVIRCTRQYIDLLETNARMAEAFQTIMHMAMEEGMFDPIPRNVIKH